MYRAFKLSPSGRVSSKKLCRPGRSASSFPYKFQDGDNVWLQALDGGSPHWRTVQDRIFAKGGMMLASDLIGKSDGEVISDHNKNLYRLKAPTLDEHIRYTKREVTPIYPTDACNIVNLLDLHVGCTAEASQGHPDMEILEAGTGHGSLTLYLAQKIQAANPPLSAQVLHEARQEARQENIAKPDVSLEALKAYKAQRNAVLHTVEGNPDVQALARSNIARFRGSFYAPHIDMHSGNVSHWLSRRLASQEVDEDGAKKPFLRHVLLDMPMPELHLGLIAQALHPGGSLLMFLPNISQVESIVRAARLHNFPFILDRTVEFSHDTSGGRDWDVRLTAVRTPEMGDAATSQQHLRATFPDGQSAVAAEPDRMDEHEGGRTASASEPWSEGSAETVDVLGLENEDSGFADMSTEPNKRLAMVARPKISAVNPRSGFVAQFRKCFPEEMKHGLRREQWRGSASRSTMKFRTDQLRQRRYKAGSTR